MTLKTALLIPCYNAERYLPSLKRQIDALKPPFDEILLVDDGSTDRTIEKGKEIGLKIEPLGVNRGPGAARNAAAKRTTADWIHFHDADDEIHEKYLQVVLPLIKDRVDVILSSSLFIDEKTREPILKWEFDTRLWSENPVLGALKTGVNTTSSFIRKTKFDAIGGFDEKFRCWEDGDMHLRLALSGAKFVSVQDTLTTSLRHSRGTSGNHLYCHRCRLSFLKKYSEMKWELPRDILVSEIIQNAEWLFQKGDIYSVLCSLRLAEKQGWEGPLTNNRLLSMLLKIRSSFSRKAAFIFQMLGRYFVSKTKTKKKYKP